jgi:hypothetical protein
MKEELYINGELVDIEGDELVTLNYKSNILGDVSKITSSYSQTISLPKTSRNRRIIDNPTAPAYISAQRYKRFDARYYRNGIDIIGKCYAVLLDSSASYEISIYWGVMAAFQSWIDAAPKLNDIPDNPSIVWQNTTATAYPPAEGASIIRADYNCGITLDDTAKKFIALHPTVLVDWILSEIEKQSGITFQIPSNVKSALHLIGIPLLKKKEYKSPTVSTNCERVHAIGKALLGGIEISASTLTHSYYVITISDKMVFYFTSITGTTFQMLGSGSVKFMLDFRISVYVDNFETVKNKGIVRWIRQGNSCSNGVIYPKSITQIKGNMYKYYFSEDVVIDSVEANDKISFMWECVDSNFSFANYYTNRSSEKVPISGTIKFVPPAVDDGDISLGENFYVVPNLPDITQIDFVKCVSALFGLYAIPVISNSSSIRFISIDEVISNKSIAYDWSKKLIDSGGGEPKTIKFAIGDYAKINNWKYKTDDNVDVDADGTIKVNNDSLAASKDIITIPFAPSDGGVIAHYKMKDDLSGVDKISCKDRIMTIWGLNSTCNLSFYGLDFQTLLGKYYSTLTTMLNSAITIKDKVRLSEYDLKTIDFSIPVYIRQYGHYYAISSIQTGDNWECTVEMIQLPRNSESVTPTPPPTPTPVATIQYSTDSGTTWVDTMPTNYASLAVKTTSGNTISSAEIANICAVASAGAKVDFSQCNYSGTGGGTILNNINDGEELSNIMEFICPGNVTEIGAGCFANTSITRITLPDSLTTIGSQAFMNSAIESITIPGLVNYIATHAFYSAGNLSEMHLYPVNPPVLEDNIIFQHTSGGIAYVTEIEPYTNDVFWQKIVDLGWSFSVK